MTNQIVSAYSPDGRSGRSRRTIGIALALARTEQVEVIYVPYGAPPSRELVENPRISLRSIHTGRGLKRALTYARARVAGVPAAFARGLSTELLEEVSSAVATRVILDGPTVAGALLLAPGSSRYYYNGHNLESSFRHRLPRFRRSFGSRRALERFERRIIDAAVETWLPSHDDVREALRLAPSARVKLVPNVIDVEAILPAVPRSTMRAVFVADYSYSPNAHAAEFLVDQVMPLVWADLPTARLALVGQGLQLQPSDDRIEVLDYVDDLRDAYGSSDCAVVPLFSGGGTPLKLVEAMGYGLPVVATSRAGDSIGANESEHYIAADDAEQFAQAISRLMVAPDTDLGRRARSFIEEHYSVSTVAQRLEVGR